MENEHLRQEIERNFDAFQRNVGAFLPNEAGRFALMQNGGVIEFYDTIDAAERAGRTQFPDGIYSIQEVVVEPVDLGFFSHVGH